MKLSRFIPKALQPHDAGTFLIFIIVCAMLIVVGSVCLAMVL